MWLNFVIKRLSRADAKQIIPIVIRKCESIPGSSEGRNKGFKFKKKRVYDKNYLKVRIRVQMKKKKILEFNSKNDS